MATHPLPMSGPVEISRSVARFTDFSGEMQLEYVGQLPPDNGHETANAWVYRVKNAEEYSVLNRSNHDFPCHIRYLTIQQRGPVTSGWAHSISPIGATTTLPVTASASAKAGCCMTLQAPLARESARSTAAWRPDPDALTLS